jgi:toxin ParE1/3/4
MKLHFSPLALDRLEEIHALIALDSPATAAHIAERLVTAAYRLENFPLIGRGGRIAGTRELVVSGLPYILPYRVRAGTVEIISVLHTSRKWPVKL